MRPTWIAAVLGTAITVSAQEPTFQSRLDQSGLAAKLRELGSEPDATGRAAVVVQMERGVWIGTSGHSNVGDRRLMTQDTMLPLGEASAFLFELAFQVLIAEQRISARDRLRDLLGDIEPTDEWLGRQRLGDLVAGDVAVARYFRRVSDPSQARPLLEVLETHGFEHPTRMVQSYWGSIGRAAVLDGLLRGGVLEDWGRFLAREFGPGIRMPGLRDASHIEQERRGFRLYEDRVERSVPYDEVPCAGNTWARPVDFAGLLSFLLDIVGSEAGPEALGDRWNEWSDYTRDDLVSHRLIRYGSKQDTLRMILWPDSKLGLFLYGNDAEDDWAEDVEEAVATAWIRPAEEGWNSSFGGAAGRLSPRPAKSSGKLEGIWSAEVPFLAEPVTLRVGSTLAEVDLILGGEVVGSAKANSVRTGLFGAGISVGFPFAPDVGGDTDSDRIHFVMTWRKDTLTGMVTWESSDHRLPYRAEMTRSK